MPTFAPRAELKARVIAIDVIESGGGEQLVLPSTSAVLGFQFRGRVRAGAQLLSEAGVTGLQSGARHYAYEPNTASILVRFSPQGAACLGVPAAELCGHSVDLAAILPPQRVREAQEKLCEAPALHARIAVVEELLLELPFAPDPLVARALRQLAGAPNTEAGIAEVARSLALGERQLERRFLAQVGVSPKRFAALARFERALDIMKRAPSLTDAAFAAGYYDQSHFIREFRRFAGVAPGKLRGTR